MKWKEGWPQRMQAFFLIFSINSLITCIANTVAATAAASRCQDAEPENHSVEPWQTVVWSPVSPISGVGCKNQHLTRVEVSEHQISRVKSYALQAHPLASWLSSCSSFPADKPPPGTIRNPPIYNGLCREIETPNSPVAT